jgi:hypothetical protein
MRKIFFIMSIIFLFVIVSACGNEEVDGDGKRPADIPVEWVNAEVQKNQSKMLELLAEKSKALDPEDRADNQNDIKEYKLTEWKVTDDRFFYEIIYQHPSKNSVNTELMEVIKTDSGWKRTKYGDLRNFDDLIAGLEPKVIRELQE